MNLDTYISKVKKLPRLSRQEEIDCFFEYQLLSGSLRKLILANPISYREIAKLAVLAANIRDFLEPRTQETEELLSQIDGITKLVSDGELEDQTLKSLILGGRVKLKQGQRVVVKNVPPLPLNTATIFNLYDRILKLEERLRGKETPPGMGMTSQELTRLALKIKKLDGRRHQLITKIIRATLYIVPPIVMKYGHGDPNLIMNLIQYGNDALLRAIDGFKLEKKCRFSTYASVLVIQDVRQSLAADNNFLSVPLFRMREFRETSERLKQKLERDPTFEEIAKAMRTKTRLIESLVLSQSKVHWVRREDDDDSSPDMALHPHALEDVIEDSSTPEPSARMDEEDQKKKVMTLLNALPPEEREIVWARLFGELPDERLSTEAVLRESVRQKALYVFVLLNRAIHHRLTSPTQ